MDKDNAELSSPEISKIRLPNEEEYFIKDEELRDMLNILLGIKKPE